LIAEDFLATVFQHELDHLSGKLFIDRIDDITTLSFEDELTLTGEEKDL
jgi:peptide deformylase